jgi:hypothetical protein
MGVRPHRDYVLDRPEVGAPRGVEPTGTNGRGAIIFVHVTVAGPVVTTAVMRRNGDGRSMTVVLMFFASAFRSACRKAWCGLEK